jgi:hypothetical protein
MTMQLQDMSYYIPDPNEPKDMARCFVKKSDLELEQFPLDPALISKYQEKDKSCARYRGDKGFKTRSLEGVKVLTTEAGRLVVPSKLQERILAWYHLYLRHPGASKMYNTMEIGFWWKNMRQDVEHTVRTCPTCQKFKKVKKKYGKIPPKEVSAEAVKPWERVNVDLIGPLTVKAKNGKFVLNALTMIDPATGWFEVKEVRNRTAEAVAEAFDDTWLSRYPRPRHIGFDNGGENKGLFKEMVANYGLERKPTTAYNPQANGIIERVHAVLNDALRTYELEEREMKEENTWDELLSSSAFAIRASYHSTLQASPAQLVFGRDMILPITFKIDWDALQRNKQEEANKNNARENKGRVEHEYHPGDKAYIQKERDIRKLSAPREGPFTITAVYNNGTVDLKQGAVTERVNIRRLTPHFG